jgi:ribonuclease D
MVLGMRISKSEQVSNWEAEELTEKQQRYAATDAWACLEIFKKLRKDGYLDSLFKS